MPQLPKTLDCRQSRPRWGVVYSTQLKPCNFSVRNTNTYAQYLYNLYTEAHQLKIYVEEKIKDNVKRIIVALGRGMVDNKREKTAFIFNNKVGIKMRSPCKS